MMYRIYEWSPVSDFDGVHYTFEPASLERKRGPFSVCPRSVYEIDIPKELIENWVRILNEEGQSPKIEVRPKRSGLLKLLLGE